MRIHKTLVKDSQGFVEIHEDSQEFERGFVRLWERICKTLGQDSWGFARICENLREDL